MSMPKGKDWADFMAEEWLEVMREIYRTKSTPKDMVHFPIVKYLGEQLTNAIDEMFGELDFDSPDYVMREALKNNVWDFSVAKNYNDNIAINNLLLKEDGSLRSWSDFKYEAEKIVGRSNRYLKTEYNTVVSGAQMSRLWQEIQCDKHLFPFVKFDVIMDGHTSEICSPLHNVIVSVDDPMLMYYFPPNHFNCRTTLRKLRRGVPTKNYILPDIPKSFMNNPGITGKIFTDENSYIANTPDEVLVLFSAFRNEQKQLQKLIKERRKVYEKLKKNKDYLDVEFNETNGGLKATHKLHSFDKNRGHYEQEAQDILYTKGQQIILEKEKSDKGEVVIDGIKKVDGTFNGLYCDISTILGKGKTTIKRAFNHSANKKADVAILYFPDNTTFSLERLDKSFKMFCGISKHHFKQIVYIVDEEFYIYK